MDVSPGECIELEISTLPYVKEGTVDYVVPLFGAISFWTERKINLPPVDGYHYNFNVPIERIIGTAEVSIMYAALY